MNEHICPKCSTKLRKYAVSHGAFPVCVGPYEDITTKRMLGGEVTHREIYLEHRSWLSAWICSKCGYTELETENPENLEPAQSDFEPGCEPEKTRIQLKKAEHGFA